MKLNLVKKYLLVLIIALGAFIRLYNLGQNPPGLFLDEASNGYNAYSILKTARDEYGNFMPLTFKAFGDYNPAFSVYTLVPSIGLFGLNNFAVRFPSALLGILTLPLLYLFVKKLLSDQKEISKKIPADLIALSASALLALSPWHIQFSRYDHEANFMLFLIVLALTLFVYFKKNLIGICATATVLGLALNSYHGAKVLIPATTLLLFVLYYKEIFKLKTKLILPLLILAIFALPFVLNFKNSLIRGQSVGIGRDQNPALSLAFNYLSHFSPNFLFVYGDRIPRHTVTGMGVLYYFQIPLLIAGLISILKLRGRSRNLIIGLLLISPIPAALTTPAPHALRSILFSPMWSIVTAFGIAALLTTNLKKLTKLSIFAIISAVAFYNIATYFHLYYKHYPKLKARDWTDGYQEMIKYVDSIKDGYSQIAISNYFGKPYIFLLFYSQFDPKTYHTLQKEGRADPAKNIGKFEFFGQEWKQTIPGKALIVTPPWQSHPDNVLKEFNAASDELTFTVSETSK